MRGLYAWMKIESLELDFPMRSCGFVVVYKLELIQDICEMLEPKEKMYVNRPTKLSSFCDISNECWEGNHLDPLVVKNITFVV